MSEALTLPVKTKAGDDTTVTIAMGGQFSARSAPENKGKIVELSGNGPDDYSFTIEIDSPKTGKAIPIKYRAKKENGQAAFPGETVQGFFNSWEPEVNGAAPAVESAEASVPAAEPTVQEPTEQAAETPTVETPTGATEPTTTPVQEEVLDLTQPSGGEPEVVDLTTEPTSDGGQATEPATVTEPTGEGGAFEAAQTEEAAAVVTPEPTPEPTTPTLTSDQIEERKPEAVTPATPEGEQKPERKKPGPKPKDKTAQVAAPTAPVNMAVASSPVTVLRQDGGLVITVAKITPEQAAAMDSSAVIAAVDKLQEAIDLLREAGTPLRGVVLSKIQEEENRLAQLKRRLGVAVTPDNSGDEPTGRHF